MFNTDIVAIARQIIAEKLRSTRMIVMLPILILFIPGITWGFSDPDVMLPGGVRPDNVMEVMFYTSLGIVFAGTMCGVLLSYDGISKDRFTGVLEVKLSQPMPRRTSDGACTRPLVGYPNSSMGIMADIYPDCHV